MAKTSYGRRARFSRVAVRVAVKGWRREVRHRIEDDKTMAAELIAPKPEVVVEKSGEYRTPEHGFDWRSLDLPVDAVALGHCGILDYVTIV